MTKPPPITTVEMSEEDIAFAERIAQALGYSQTAYTSTSGLWGLFCLPDSARHHQGCIIKTAEFGFMFVADLEDLKLHDLVDEARKAWAKAKSVKSPEMTLTEAQELTTFKGDA